MSNYIPQNGFWDQVVGGAKTVAKTGAGVAAALHESKVRQKIAQEQAQAAAMRQQAFLGGYGPYLVLGGIALGAIYLLKR